MHLSLKVGFEALRANPLRSILSTLGVTMGVGAMVSVLSIGDGVEQYAREQIAQTTDLLTVAVSPRTADQVDGQFIARDSLVRFTLADVRALRAALPPVQAVTAEARGGAVVPAAGGTPRGLEVRGVTADGGAEGVPRLAAGRWLADSDTGVIVLSRRAAAALAPDSLRPLDMLGRELSLRGQPHLVIGVVESTARPSGLLTYVPVADVARAAGPRAVPQLIIVTNGIEDVDSVRVRTERWAAQRLGPNWARDVQVINRRDRAEQAATAMRIFKLLMAAITGVSLLVGGVGIMNVLLASVAERTREIGIRKATGARRRDILAQFLAESVAITGLGAAIGVALGLGVAYTVAAIMRAQTEAPVQAAVTVVTVGFAVGVSVLIGLLFGLYPALRAARLSPIDAIRHE